MSEPNFKSMSNRELTTYIKAHRNDDEKIRAAIAESSSRPGWTKVSAEINSEQTAQIIQELLSKK